MDDKKIYGEDSIHTNTINPQPDDAPIDPSNTSDIGERVEQGVISIHDGISEQSAQWEDIQERNIPNSIAGENSKDYKKNPSRKEGIIKKVKHD